jgi:molybdopterin synthase catalytic subunit
MSTSISVTVLFFASSRQLTSKPSLTLVLPSPHTTTHLLSALLSLHPSLKELVEGGGMVFSVNGEYAVGEKALADGDEVAVIPPISGG